MAAVDPALRRRLTDQSQRGLDRRNVPLPRSGPEVKRPGAASQAFQTAMQGIDRSMKEGPELLFRRATESRRLCYRWSSKSTQPWCPSISGALSPRGRRSAIRAPVLTSLRLGCACFWRGTTARWPHRVRTRSSLARARRRPRVGPLCSATRI